MGRRSTIERLDQAVLEELHACFERGRTLDEVIATLRGLGVKDVSRSAVHRYKQQDYDTVVASVRESREVAKILVAEFGTDSDPKAMRANIEMMHAVLSKLIRSLTENETVDVKEISLLARALESIGRATKMDADMIARIREDARKEMEAEMRAKVQALGSAADLKGLSDEELEKKIAELARAQGT